MFDALPTFSLMSKKPLCNVHPCYENAGLLSK